MISIEKIFRETLEAESTFDFEQIHGQLAVREALTQKGKWIIRK